MGKPDTPPPPDYTSAAVAQGVANTEAARLQNRANRVDEFTPYGSRVYNDLGGDRWRSDINLTPIGQRIFDSQNRVSEGMGQASEGAIGRAVASFNQPMKDFDRDAYADALMQRSERKFGQDEQSLKARLMAGGMTQGSEGWNREFDTLNQARNDARNLAYINAGNEQGSDMERQAYMRSLPLNELNALRTGAQVNMPQFNATQPAAGVQPAPIMQGVNNQYQAGMDQYNAQAAASGNLMSGLFGIGAAAAGNPWLFASDVRLKMNIEPTGEEVNGIPLYSYEYVWGTPRMIGVMAHDVKEVMPDAVVNIGGFDHVDYGRVYA